MFQWFKTWMRRRRAEKLLRIESQYGDIMLLSREERVQLSNWQEMLGDKS